MRYFLLGRSDSLTPIESFDLLGDAFSMGFGQTLPLGAFTIVDEQLNAYDCELDSRTFLGKIVKKIELPQARMNDIANTMLRLGHQADGSKRD